MYVVDDAPGLVVTRTVAMLVNGAVDARHKGVASAADIDTAMRLGTNYPLGPLAWGEPLGPGHDRGHTRRDAGLVPRGPLPPVRPAAADHRRRRVADMTRTCMTLTWTKENSPRSDVDKQPIFDPAELAAVGLAGPAPREPVAGRMVAGHRRRTRSPGTAGSTPSGATRASRSSSRPAGAAAAWAPSSWSTWRTRPPPTA